MMSRIIIDTAAASAGYLGETGLYARHRATLSPKLCRREPRKNSPGTILRCLAAMKPAMPTSTLGESLLYDGWAVDTVLEVNTIDRFVYPHAVVIGECRMKLRPLILVDAVWSCAAVRSSIRLANDSKILYDD